MRVLLSTRHAEVKNMPKKVHCTMSYQK